MYNKIYAHFCKAYCIALVVVKEYTQIQEEGFGKNYDYWMIFISDSVKKQNISLHMK